MIPSQNMNYTVGSKHKKNDFKFWGGWFWWSFLPLVKMFIKITQFGMNMFCWFFSNHERVKEVESSKVCFFVFTIRWNGSTIFSGRCERKGAFWSRRYLKSLQNRERFGATPGFKAFFFVSRRYLGSRGSCLFQAVTDFCLSIENNSTWETLRNEQITFQGENRHVQASRFAPEACKSFLWMKFGPEVA